MHLMTRLPLRGQRRNLTGFPVSAVKRTPEGGSTLGRRSKAVKCKEKAPLEQRGFLYAEPESQSVLNAVPFLMFSSTFWASLATAASPVGKSFGSFTTICSL